jgi:hypothetical protein
MQDLNVSKLFSPTVELQQFSTKNINHIPSIGKRPPASWLPKSKAEKALHLSLFPPIPTPQEVLQRLSLQ